MSIYNLSVCQWVFTSQVLSICQFANEYLEKHLLDKLSNYNLSMSTYESTILGYGHQKDILEIKKCLLVKCDRPVLNNNISSAKLFLFDIN